MTDQEINQKSTGVILSSGDFVHVDPKDIVLVSAMRWHKDTNGYAYFHSFINGVDRPIRMHRFLLAPPSGLDVDHINGDRLDNRRVNLRTCSRQQNLWNSRIKSTNTSGFKGVDFVKSKSLFRARIRTSSGRINIGLFKTKEGASEAYKNAAKHHHAEFCKS